MIFEEENEKKEQRLLATLYEALDLIAELREGGALSEDYKNISKAIELLENHISNHQDIL